MKKRKNGNQIFKWILRTIAILLCIILLAAARFTYVTKYKIGNIDKAISPNGEYEVLYQSVGEPDWPFGASHARLVLKNEGKTVLKQAFDVANDGAILFDDSWQVRWQEDCVRITISGEEQDDEIFTLYFDGRVERSQ